jgi:hypothetical protein
MRELLRRVEVTAEANAEDARVEGAARLEALKASVGRQLRPVSAAVADVAAYVEGADEREAARSRALKASVTKQLQPLAAAVQAAVARSDRQLAEIHARLDALGAPKVRPVKRAAPKKQPPAPPAAAEPVAPAAQPPGGGLLIRRRTAARPKAPGPRAEA